MEHNDNKKRVIFWIDEELLKRLKAKAESLNCSLNEYVESVLMDAISR